MSRMVKIEQPTRKKSASAFWILRTAAWLRLGHTDTVEKDPEEVENSKMAGQLLVSKHSPITP